MIVKAGSTNVSVYYYIVQDASGTSPGEPVTGLLFSDIETGGSASYMRQGGARVDLTLITLASASATHANGGFILVDDTNMPGLYRCDYPDAAFAAGVDQTFCQIVVESSNNAVAAPILIDIDGSVNQTGDNFARLGAPAGASVSADNAGIKTTVDAIPTTAMRGTDSAALASVCTETRLAELDAGNMPADIDAIPTTAMRGTDSAALATVCTETRLAELDAANMPADIDAIPTTAMRGTDGVDTATMRGTDGANTVVPDAAGTAPTLAEIQTTALTESYAANGAEPTQNQLLYAIHQMLMEFGIAGTSYTVKQLDSTTTAFVVTLDDATNPTSATR